MKLVVCKIFFLTVKLIKNSHIDACIFFIFLKNVLNQTWSSFNTKFQPHWKDLKRSYQVWQVLGHFLALNCSKFSLNQVRKALELTRKSKKLNLKGVLDELESKEGLKRQYLAKYLRLTLVFMWNSTRPKKFNFYFPRVFF